MMLTFSISGNLLELHNDLLFVPEITKVDKIKKLVANLRIKKDILYTLEILDKLSCR